MKVLEQYEYFKIIYADVVQGRSWCDKYSCYVKHFTDLDYARLIRRKAKYAEGLKKEGIPTEVEKLASLKEQGTWGEKEEEEILTLKYLISDNSKMVEKMPVPSQRAPIEKIIQDKRRELALLEYRRGELIHPTVEYYGLRYYSTIFPQAGMFKDEKFLVPRFTEEEYDGMEDDEVGEINIHYLKTLEEFNEKNFRALACLPLVINQLSFCKKNLLNYIGKPIVEFTVYQQDIYSKAIRNLNILEQTDGEPPEIQEDTKVQELMDWYDLNYSILQGKRNKDAGEGSVKTSKTYVHK